MRTLKIIFLISAGFSLISCSNMQNNLKKAEKSSNINVELGITYMREGNYDTAMDRLQKAIQQNPENPLAYSSLALLQMHIDQRDRVENNFLKAISLAPDNSSIKNNYGTFLCQQKRFPDAQEQFLAATKNPLYKTPEHAYLNAGKCTDDKGLAEKYFRIALQKNPTLPGALLEMARLGLDLKRYLSSRAYLQRYHAVRDPIAKSLWISIQVEKQLGDKTIMRQHAMLLQGKFPDSVETGLYLQWVNK